MDIINSFSSYLSNNIAECKTFYESTLGLAVSEQMGGLRFQVPGGQQVFIYPKDDYQPAEFTVLNFVVADINAAIDELTSRGAVFERYGSDTLPAEQDERGVLRGKSTGIGPDIAWFKDPAGNILSLIEE